MTNALQNACRCLAKSQEDDGNAAYCQQHTAVRRTGEQHLNDLRTQCTDTHSRRHRNDHRHTISQCHFSAYLFFLFQLYRCRNAGQYCCSNGCRDRNRQCSQSNIFTGKLTIQGICLCRRKACILQDIHNHTHIDQVCDTEYCCTCNDGPCCLQHFADQFPFCFFIRLSAAVHSPQQIFSDEGISKNHNDQTCQRTDTCTHCTAGRCQRNVFLHAFRYIHAEEYPCQIYTEEGIEYLFNDL